MKFKIQSRCGQELVRDVETVGLFGALEPGQGIDLHLYFADAGDHCVK